MLQKSNFYISSSVLTVYMCVVPVWTLIRWTYQNKIQIFFFARTFGAVNICSEWLRLYFTLRHRSGVSNVSAKETEE